MIGLDINTIKGQKSLAYEAEMLDIIRQYTEIIETPKKSSAKCDGMFHKKGILKGVFESKCRDLSDIELKEFGSWVITYKKIKDLRKLSKMLKVPGYGFLYLLKDKKIRVWKIVENGNWSFRFNVRKTLTQKTINGGEIYRLNAYLPVEESKLIYDRSNKS